MDYKTVKGKINEIVAAWDLGDITEAEVLDQSEDIWEAPSEDWPMLPKNDPSSITIEVLSQLSSLNIQLICKDDIMEIFTFLNAEEGKEVEAWERWERYWDSMDYKDQAARLKENDIYLLSDLL